MARYLQRYFLELPAEQVEATVQAFLARNAFRPVEWEGEACWEAADPAPDTARFFKYKYENRVIEVQAWLQTKKEKEMELAGYGARKLKIRYLELIESMYDQLFTLIPQDSPLYAIDRDTLAEDRRLRRIQPFVLPGVILVVLFIVLVAPRII